jgi:hypothetical protein
VTKFESACNPGAISCRVRYRNGFNGLQKKSCTKSSRHSLEGGFFQDVLREKFGQGSRAVPQAGTTVDDAEIPGKMPQGVGAFFFRSFIQCIRVVYLKRLERVES